MKWTLSLFFLLGAVSFLGFWYLEDPGYIKIIWLGVEVQLSLVVGIFILLCFFFVSRCLFWFLGIPFRWASFFQQARGKKATHDLLNLYTAFEAENFTGALQLQKKALKRLNNDPLFLWISGNVFEKADKPFDAEKCFMALSQSPLAPFLGLKGQIQMALQKGDSRLALALLEQAEKLAPTSPWVLKHLLTLAYEQNALKKAEELTLRLEDLGYLSSDVSKSKWPTGKFDSIENL